MSIIESRTRTGPDSLAGRCPGCARRSAQPSGNADTGTPHQNHSPLPSDVEVSDAELMTLVRNDEISAYAVLYRRHVGSAYRQARLFTRSKSEADDLVSEAFAKVLNTLRAGRGPADRFRAYLLTALRNAAYDQIRRDRKLEWTADVSQVHGIRHETLSVPFTDPAIAGLERRLVAQAFATLPERWQRVLWHTEVDGRRPGDLAPLFGISPNSVCALAYRAREGLKLAYLRAELTGTRIGPARSTIEQLENSEL
jgi:RNA polymerase sigma factor (sigma-70 family)